MIWIKENYEIVGYVPILKKEYTDDEIREMSKYCQSQHKGWSKLSSLVMHVQGISYSYINDSPRVHNFYAPSTLYKVVSDFGYECFSGFPDFETKQYINQIFDVFENLTLYRVEQHSISFLLKKVDDISDYLSRFMDNYDIKCRIRGKLARTLLTAKSNAINLENLLNLFSDNGLVLSHSIFEEADEEIIEKVKHPRENLRPEKLVKSIYD